mmetsp:Transcript_3442/g.15693  ORF Transcript_3442/g.15693 Transcript_3442/m.15693 type:complete len:218 (+) Transcript_3442:3208-3861(+)
MELRRAHRPRQGLRDGAQGHGVRTGAEARGQDVQLTRARRRHGGIRAGGQRRGDRQDRGGPARGGVQGHPGGNWRRGDGGGHDRHARAHRRGRGRPLRPDRPLGRDDGGVQGPSPAGSTRGQPGRRLLLLLPHAGRHRAIAGEERGGCGDGAEDDGGRQGVHRRAADPQHGVRVRPDVDVARGRLRGHARAQTRGRPADGRGARAQPGHERDHDAAG